MPYCPKFELATFDELGPSWKRGILGALVEALVMADRAYLRDFPNTPGLYDAGIPYVFNRDRWQDIPTMLKRREGDCKDFTAWRVAELRQQGIKAAVHVTDRLISSPDGRLTMYHVLVRLPGDMIEDPSRMLGMDDGGANVFGMPVPSLAAGSPAPFQLPPFQPPPWQHAHARSPLPWWADRSLYGR